MKVHTVVLPLEGVGAGGCGVCWYHQGHNRCTFTTSPSPEVPRNPHELTLKATAISSSQSDLDRQSQLQSSYHRVQKEKKKRHVEQTCRNETYIKRTSKGNVQCSCTRCSEHVQVLKQQ